MSEQNRKSMVNCWASSCIYNKELVSVGIRFCSLNAVFISLHGTCMCMPKKKECEQKQ